MISSTFKKSQHHSAPIRHQKKDTQIFALTEYGISVNIHIEKLVPFSETSLFYISRY